MTERTEALLRIVVFIISGIILSIWRFVIEVIVIIHWFIVIFSGKRNKSLSEFSHVWNTQVFIFLKYMTFASNKRPFPFEKLGKIDKID